MRYLNARNTAFGEDRKVYSTVDSTATAGQTVFNVSYDQGRVAVFLNGIRLIPVQDYTYTLSGLGTTITLGAGISANDYLELIGLQGINAGNALTEDNFVVGTSSTGSGGSYTNSTTVFPVSSSAGDLVSVWRNGIKLVPTTDFTVNATANTVTLQSASNTADEITVHVVGILQHSNFVQTTGGTFTGNVGIGASTVDEQLHIKGTEAVIKLEDSAVTGEGFIDFDGSSLQLNTHRNPNTGANPNNKAPASIILSGNDADSSIRFYTKASNSGAGISRMTIDKDGNVAISQTLSGNIDVSSNTLTTSTAQKQAISATAFASGTKMIFNQTSAPTGWTKDTSSNNNSALRVVTGTAGTGGSQDFTSAFGATISVAISNASHTLAISEMPAHTHISKFFPQGGSYTSYYPGLPGHSGGTTSNGTAGTSTGGGGSHTHNNSLSGTGSSGSTHNLSVKYVDVIVATKD